MVLGDRWSKMLTDGQVVGKLKVGVGHGWESHEWGARMQGAALTHCRPKNFHNSHSPDLYPTSLTQQLRNKQSSELHFVTILF